MVAAWGHRAAAIDLDTLYRAIDPLWELEYDNGRNAMVLEQAVYWVRSLVHHGWLTVILAGNSVFDPYDTAPVAAGLGDLMAVHHVLRSMAATRSRSGRWPAGCMSRPTPSTATWPAGPRSWTSCWTSCWLA